MAMNSLYDIDLSGKYVLLRDDFNVQIVDGKITDLFRIESSKKTIDFLVRHGAKVVICSHFGRPNGRVDKSLSLKFVADFLHIPFIPDCLDKSFLSNMKNGDVVLLENLRFYTGEENNDDDFAKKLATGFDLYINDAFAVSHRECASIIGITKYLPAYPGFLLLYEIENLTNILRNTRKPLFAFIGGAKISTKLGLLKKLVTIADALIVGGGMGTTFAYSHGYNIGNSLCEKNMVDVVSEIEFIAQQHNCQIYYPLDKGVGANFDKYATRENRNIKNIYDTDVIMDDGDETIARNIQLLQGNISSVIWNGTFGMAEWGQVWGKSTFAFIQELAKQTKLGNIHSYVGGGDTVAALDFCQMRENITYVSTGGGAFLEYIEKDGHLVGLDILQN